MTRGFLLRESISAAAALREPANPANPGFYFSSRAGAELQRAARGFSF